MSDVVVDNPAHRTEAKNGRSEPQARARDRDLLWHGMLLFLLGLVTGLLQQALTNPRMGLSAHLEGVMNGMLLLVLGAVWSKVRLSPRCAAVAYRMLLAGTYGNWGVTLLAAILGTKAMTPIAAAGYGAKDFSEVVVATGFVGVGVLMLLACGLLLAGFRPIDREN